MLPLHVGWYLTLPTPSNKLALANQNLMHHPTQKNHKPHATLPKNSAKTHNSQWLGRRWHKEVVSAQGAAVEATVGIGRSFGG
jgi:hypothetical protein